MSRMMRSTLAATSIAAALLVAVSCSPQDGGTTRPSSQPVGANGTVGDPSRKPDVEFVPTHQEVVEKMLELAEVTEDDVVYDLGCGDGRIVITAAKKYGCTAMGVDIDPDRVHESSKNVRENGLEHLVTIKKGDVFELDLRPASVVAIYLLPELNVKLIPQLDKLEDGSRIVSHSFDMQGVTPELVHRMTTDDGQSHTIYLWRTPLQKE